MCGVKFSKVSHSAKQNVFSSFIILSAALPRFVLYYCQIMQPIYVIKFSLSSRKVISDRKITHYQNWQCGWRVCKCQLHLSFKMYEDGDDPCDFKLLAAF